VVSTVIWLMLWRRRPIDTDKPELNVRGERMMGMQITLDEPITNGEGTAKFGDTMWRIRGPDFVRGTRVKVVDVHGTVLIVDKI
jgi:membrane protein implicated in regulation of membrane protease activity